jgi:hypothetical protein
MAKLTLESTIKLKSGYELPVLGYGVSDAILGMRTHLY